MGGDLRRKLGNHTRLWASTDFNAINALTSLDGTKVIIGGKSAFVDYISPGQVNALLPSDTHTGMQQLISPTRSSAAININVTQPGLLAPVNY